MSINIKETCDSDTKIYNKIFTQCVNNEYFGEDNISFEGSYWIGGKALIMKCKYQLKNECDKNSIMKCPFFI